MSEQQAISTLLKMSDNGALDSKITSLAIEHYKPLRDTCLSNQNRAAKEYENIELVD
jgi:hypothetical protein